MRSVAGSIPDFAQIAEIAGKRYYEVNCPQWFIDKVNSGSFMVEDLAEIMYGNDFNYTNILKAQKRMYEMEKGGGKEGNTLEYDATKCKYYVDKQLEITKRGE